MVVKLVNLAKTFHTAREKLHILKDIQLELPPSSICTITGESGCGKTTLISLLAGLEKAENGSIEIFNYRVDRMSEEELSNYRSTIIGVIFQFHFLLEDFTALENLMLPSLMLGVNRKQAQVHAGELLDAVGMFHRRDHIPAQLSGGERQRVAVARALMNNPEMLLADEPTGNLDERNSALVSDLLVDITRRYKKTLLVVTHDESLSKRGDFRYELRGGVLHSL